MIRLVDEHRDRFSIEFICQTLKNNRKGGLITSSEYRQNEARGIRARALRREGIDLGSEQTVRLMRQADLSVKGKDGAPITTRKPKSPDPRLDLFNREFTATYPSCLWVGRHHVCSHSEGVRVHSVCYRRVFPPDCWLGAVRFDAHFRR